jgi:hypothetical protein
LAQSSEDPSFYFRHEITDFTMTYVQGLIETICGLWPNGKLFIGKESFNPRNSLTPSHLSQNDILTSSFEKYFNDPSVLGNLIANDYRQLIRGSFPFLMESFDNTKIREERERDMSVDAWFIERGVFKFERTSFIREHLMVDHNRHIRIYVDGFDGTKYLVYYNHRIARFNIPFNQI